MGKTAKATWFGLLLPLALLCPLDGEPLGKRAYYHFYLNAHYDPARESFVVPELPFRLTGEDVADLMLMVDEHGHVRTRTATTSLGSSRFAHLEQYVPETVKKAIVNGTVAYASQVQRDNPAGAAAMFRVRDRVVERLRASGVMPGEVYGVDDRSLWSAFSVTSIPSAEGSFEWHYDAESRAEYRALFIVHGGDDCGNASVHYMNTSGHVADLAVRTGSGYLIRGSQTFHAVYHGGCPTPDGSLPFRHMVGFQVSETPHRWPKPLCWALLQLTSSATEVWFAVWSAATMWTSDDLIVGVATAVAAVGVALMIGSDLLQLLAYLRSCFCGWRPAPCKESYHPCLGSHHFRHFASVWFGRGGAAPEL